MCLLHFHLDLSLSSFFETQAEVAAPCLKYCCCVSQGREREREHQEIALKRFAHLSLMLTSGWPEGVPGLDPEEQQRS